MGGAVTREQMLAALEDRGIGPDVVAAMARVDRERFVPASERAHAWDDCALPIGGGQTISQPYLVAYMVELLDLRPTDRVLDVGTGSGYHAAVLAQLGEHVWSLERDARLSAQAGEALAAAGVSNVTLAVGDGARGWPEQAPFGAINVAAAVERDLPPALVDQLAEGGRLIAPVRERQERLVLVRRVGGRLARSDHGAVRFVPLVSG